MDKVFLLNFDVDDDDDDDDVDVVDNCDDNGDDHGDDGDGDGVDDDNYVNLKQMTIILYFIQLFIHSSWTRYLHLHFPLHSHHASLKS
jgi:hypothetical protein